ncbi:MAG: co-chaperone GroES [bacterium]|nr:co-chaperone GroES [bacterium]
MAKSSKSGTVNIIPIGDRVLVKEKKEDAEKKTASGIFIPESASDGRETKQGEVVSVGEGKYEDGKLVPVKVKKGDIVLFQWGDFLKVDNEEYQVVSASNILAIIK